MDRNTDKNSNLPRIVEENVLCFKDLSPKDVRVQTWVLGKESLENPEANQEILFLTCVVHATEGEEANSRSDLRVRGQSVLTHLHLLFAEKTSLTIPLLFDFLFFAYVSCLSSSSWLIPLRFFSCFRDKMKSLTRMILLPRNQRYVRRDSRDRTWHKRESDAASMRETTDEKRKVLEKKSLWINQHPTGPQVMMIMSFLLEMLRFSTLTDDWSEHT